MVKKIFSDYQRDLIRNALLEAKIESTKSWADIATSIEVEFEDSPQWKRAGFLMELQNVTGVEFSKPGNLGRFVKGEILHMEPICMIAIANWLISDNNCWSVLSSKKVFNMPIHQKVALQFADFLHEHADDVPKTTSAQLENGCYLLESNKSTFILTIHTARTAFVLPVSLVEIRNIHPNRYTNSARLQKDISYTGWIIITPNDSLFCMLINTSEACNQLYIPVGIGDEILSNKIHSLIFLNQPSVEYFDYSNININNADILSDWTKSNKNNCLRFDRINKAP